MKVDLPIEEGYFNIDPCVFCGIEGYLITPQPDVKWNKNNLHLRSVIIDKAGAVLSSGFKKFFNYLEKPDCYPSPEKFHDWRIEEKKDGSLLICDYVNDQFSMRTRGSVSHLTQQNFEEFELLPQKYPKVLDFLSKNPHLSILFEIVSPSNVIVIRPKEVEFSLLSAINKNTLEPVSAEDLLDIWRGIGCPNYPEIFNFNYSRDLESICSYIKEWKGREGIVLTYNNGKNKIKLKSEWYLLIHRVKSKLNSTNNLIEQYLKWREPAVEVFLKKIETDYDYEIAIQLKDEIENISLAGEKCKGKLLEINNFVNKLKNMERKNQAAEILEKYQKEGLTGLAFSMLDGKEIENKNKFTLIKKYLEHERK